MLEQALHQLADEAGRAVVPPGFADLAHRARRRRLRRRAGIGLAALGCGFVVSVAALLSSQAGDRTAPPVTPPGPTSPKPTTSPHFLLRHPDALVNQFGAQVGSASYADAVHAAALWQVCTVPMADGSCPQVVTWTSDGWQTSRARLIPDKLAIYALPDGSVVVWLFDGGFVLDQNGHRHDLVRSADTVATAPDDRYVNLPSGPGGGNPAGMLDTRTGTVYRPLSSPSTRCTYDDQWDTNGTIWEYGAPRCGPHQEITLSWSSDLGHTWSTRAERRPILALETTPHRTAVLLGDQTNELAALDTTRDGGRHWHLSVLRHPIAAPDRFAVTPDGAMFVTASRVYAADSTWSSFHPIGPSSLTALGLTAADGVVATYGGTADRIEVSNDDGTTWHAVSPRPRPRPRRE